MFPTWIIHIVLSQGLFFIFIEKLLCKQKQKDLAELTTCRNTPLRPGQLAFGAFRNLNCNALALGDVSPYGPSFYNSLFFYYFIEQYYIVLDDFILKFTRDYSLYVIILKKNLHGTTKVPRMT